MRNRHWITVVASSVFFLVLQGSTTTESSQLAASRKLRGVIGTDDRAQVNDTRVYPYNSIGILLVPGEPNYKCTAALLDANHALTSASCVLESDAENNTLLTNISEMVFVPGAIISPSITTATQSLNYKAPFGVYNVSKADFPSQWNASLQTAAFNYAVIKLDKHVSIPGIFGFKLGCQSAVGDNATLDLHIAGYPQDRQFAETTTNCPKTVVDFSQAVVQHTCDTDAGMAGSPMWIDNSNSIQHQICAVHHGTTAKKTGENLTVNGVSYHYNQAAVVNADVEQFINSML